MSMIAFNNATQQNIIYHVSSKAGIKKRNWFIKLILYYITVLTDSVDETSDEIHCTKYPKIVIDLHNRSKMDIIFLCIDSKIPILKIKNKNR